jgi:hypothetical protein
MFIAVVSVSTKIYPEKSVMATVQDTINGFSALIRDFLLVVIFLVFVVHLRLGIRDQREGIDEKILVRFTVMLAIALLVRGVLSLTQGLIYQNGTSDCDKKFWWMILAQEIMIEGGPFLVLIRTNTKYLVECHNYAEKASVLLCRSSIDV